MWILNLIFLTLLFVLSYVLCLPVSVVRALKKWKKGATAPVVFYTTFEIPGKITLSILKVIVKS